MPAPGRAAGHQAGRRAGQASRGGCSGSDHAVALEDHDQPARAKISYDKALAIDPDNALAHAGMARVLKKLGDTSGAAKHEAEAKRLKPE